MPQPSQGSRLRVGLIGVGQHMKENLLPVLQSMPGLQIAAVSSRCQETAASLAAAHGIPDFTGDWRDLLAPDRLDAVIVAAPPDVHAEVASAALARGVSVFLEKPPAPDLATLTELCRREDAAAPGCAAFVDYNFRFSEGFTELARTMSQRGDLRCLKVRFLTSKPKATLWHCRSVAESYLYAIAIHPVETAIHLFGEPRDLHAGWTALGPDTFSLQLTMRFDAGRAALLELGNYSNRFACRYEWLTDRGAAGILSDLQTFTFYDSRQARTAERQVQSPLRGGYRRGGYEAALQHFVESVRSRQPSSSPLRASLPVYRVLEEVLHAIGPLPMRSNV